MGALHTARWSKSTFGVLPCFPLFSIPNKEKGRKSTTPKKENTLKVAFKESKLNMTFNFFNNSISKFEYLKSTSLAEVWKKMME